MDRLTLNRRQKTTGDKIDCIPAGDGLPIWTTIPFDAKLPMMQNPKGSVVLYTTKLGEPKHRCKQEYDFDLRDPNGQYISNEYQPLHDPHLRSHFNTQVMRRHLIKKGFISEDGKVLCSLKEFNQYRQYLRHIYFLEIAKERKEELDGRLTQSSEHRREMNLDKQMSRGSLVRRRLQQQRDRDLNKLKRNINDKACTLERRLKAIREEMVRRERKQREEAERRQMAVFKNQQENEHRNLMMLKRWRNRDKLRTKLLADRETQRKMQAELKCIEKWTARKKAQTSMMEKTNELMKQEDEERTKSIGNREQTINKKREKLEKKIEKQKQLSREEKQKKDDHYFKRLEEKLASGDYRIWTKRKERKKSPKKTFLSTWKLQDVLRTFEVPDRKRSQADPTLMEMLNDAIDTAVHIVVDQSNDLKYEEQARGIVDDVIAKVKNDLYPQFLQLLDVDNNEEENDAMKSKSVRFSSDEAEIKTDHSSSSEAVCYLKPVTEHVLTPVASQLEIAKLEAEAILGSPELSDKISSVTFVETLLLRLLDDLNSGKLNKDEIMKLASYSMDIIQSAETDNNQDDVIVEVPEEAEAEGPYLVGSSSSIIAKKMVDFTLSKILSEVQTGSVHPDDIASLTVSLMDNVAGCDSGDTISDNDSALEALIDATLQRAASTAKDKREDSPVCDAMLDDFMVSTLKKIIRDLEEEVLTQDQVQHLAASVTEETRSIIPRDIDNLEKQDVQNVLHELLVQLQSGDFGIQTMYQVVFAIVCAYNTMRSPSKPGIEKHFTELLNDLLLTVEQRAASGELGEININIVHEATTRLSQTKLDSKQIENISSCLVDNKAVSDRHMTMLDEDSTKLEKASEVISKAKLIIENGNNDTTLQQGMENVAEAVINFVQDPCTSLSFIDVFMNILQELKRVVENIEGCNDMSATDLQDLIDKIASNSISQDVLLEIASSVVRVIRSPVKSESSFTAALAVTSCLKAVLDDIRDGSLDDSFIQEMIGSLKVCLTAAESTGRKTPSFINSLSSFLKNVLNQLTFKVQTGEMTEDDIAELSQVFKSKISHTDDTSEKVDENKIQVVQGETNTEMDLTNILHHIQQFVDNTNLDELNAEGSHAVGLKLIECGQKLVKSFRDNASVPVTPNTETFADNIVEEVIKTLQMEIESGILSTETLKDVTNVIIDSTSTSEIANEVVTNTFRGIQRDINRGYQPTSIPSVPSLNHSPSASTVASHIVLQTINSICKDILSKGIPPTMISSLASTIISDLSGESPLIRALPEEFQRFKPTIVNIIQCLKEDKVSESCAESMFCLILEKYKTCVLESQGKEQDAEDLSGEDISLIDALVVETLDNVRRSVAKGRVVYKAFSIPSIPHSEDSSIIAIDLIDTCLENIRRSVAAEKAMPEQPKHDLVDFILEILTRLQSELVDGTISNLSMAHFYKAISDDCGDMKSLEANAAGNLSIVINDIKRFREYSEFVHRIIETYLTPDRSSDEVFTDPLKAIEVILVNVSSEILTKFVKATLQTILMEIRSDSTPLSDKTPSAYVLRSATSIIAENVIKEVVSRIRQDMSKSIHKIHGTVCKQDIERAASRIVNESPRVAARQSSTAGLKKQDSKHSGVSSTSKEVEDLVLETLHNIVSNLRLEQSMKSLKGSKQSSSTSLEIEDFVLSSLQSIIIDQQDIRSQIEIGVEKTSSKYGGSSIELVSGESKEAMAYVNEVLQNVLREMKEEIAIKEESNKGSDMESCNVQTMILEYLQKALFDTLAPDSLTAAVELYHQDDIRKILLESITATIANIRDDKFSHHDIDTMYKACKRFFDEVDPEYVVENVDTVTPKMIIELMDQVKVKIEALDLDNNTFDNISTQLATLGMDSTPPEKTASDHTTSELSVSSSYVSELVRDVITRISAQLNNEMSDKARNNSHEPNKVELSHSNVSGGKHVSQTTSTNSSVKNDVNYNRRLSISTASSHTSVQSITSSNETITGEKIIVKPSAQVKEMQTNGNQCPTKCYQKCQISPSPGKKLMKRPSEARPVIRQSPKPAKTCSNPTKTTKLMTDKVRNKPCVQSQSSQKHNSLVHHAMSPKSSKDKPSSCQVRSNKATLNSTASKIKSFTKSPNKVKEIRSKSPFIGTNEMRTQKEILDTEKDRDQPLELRSLCGAHRTKLSYKDARNLSDDN